MEDKMFGENGMDNNDAVREDNVSEEVKTTEINGEKEPEVKAESEAAKPAADYDTTFRPVGSEYHGEARPQYQPPQHGYPPFNGFGADAQRVNNANPPVNEQYNGAPTGEQHSNEPQNNSGEYRYKPPYAAYGANCPPPAPHHPPYNAYNGGGHVPPYTPPQPPHNNYPPVDNAPKKAQKPKKKIVGRTFSTGAIAILLMGCVLLSFGAGFGGAYIANTFNGGSGSVGAGDDLVIYKSVMLTDENDEEIKEELTVSQVEEIVADSVVEITTEFQTSYGPFQYVNSGAGSGVIISDNGYVITNNHVIVGNDGEISESITVRLKNTEEYEAKVIGTDSDSDIALLKIEAEELTFAVCGDSDTLKVGQSIIAVGNPLGELGGTVTSGIVSATGRTINVDGTEMKLIQIDAAVNPGNSGGGLFNRKGELVGIVNAKSTGSGIEGLGFAIPINDAVAVSEQLKTNGYVTGRSFIGVTFVDVTDAFTAYRYFGTQNTGVYVYSMSEGYNEGTLQSGDRIVAVDGAEINSSEEIKTLVKSKEVGDVLKFTVYRKGALVEVDVTCYEYVPENAVDFSQQ